MSVDGAILLIRHGRTDGNGARYVGWEDVPLNAAGRAQAARVAELLAGEQIDAVYASSLSRALETARPLADACGLPVLPRDELREIHYGALQGTAKAERRIRVRHDHRETPLPGGESLRDVYARVARLGAELATAAASGGRIALVGHFWSVRMLAGALLGIPFAELPGGLAYKPGNGAVARIAWPAGATCGAQLAVIATGEEDSE
jgi:broad specificity phosphatase PhoE